MSHYHLFTSESVSPGHPDKIADQISDAVLDEILKQDPLARVACETYIKTGMVLVGGEITTEAWVDIETLTREVIQQIGYTDPKMGFDYAGCAVLNAIGKQSEDIAKAVDETLDHEQGAGDQGTLFGYATNETVSFMPAPIVYAHLLMQRQTLLRQQNTLPWLWPDAKSQVTFVYEEGRPVSVKNIVFSTQHAPEISQSQIIEAVMEEIIKPVIPSQWLKPHTQYLINPAGRFVIGGPMGDCGLTGRKIIVDTYGGMAHHGGGAMSGKDPSKIDRSGAYMARYIAKNIVAAGLADKIEVQISYAIGVAEPTAIDVETFDTGRVPQERIVQLITEHFDLRPKSIITTLDLLKPIYRSTAVFGHFGRTDILFNWEKIDKADLLRACAFH